VTSDACEAVKAAFEGRVADLFFTPNAQSTEPWAGHGEWRGIGDGAAPRPGV